MTKVLTCSLVDGQWKIESKYSDLPLTMRDKLNLDRALKMEVKNSLREYNLKQRALQREKALTGKKVGL